MTFQPEKSCANLRENGRGDRYQYDDAGQLTQAAYQAENAHDTAGTAERTDAFRYDEMGNRTGANWVASRGLMKFAGRNNKLNQYGSWENNISWPDPLHWGLMLWYDDAAPEPAHAPWLPPGNGVLMGDGWNVAGFNALNQPVQMTSFFYEGTGNWMWFGYDPLGRCVKRWVGPGDGSAPNGATYFYYDGWNLVQEGLSANSVARTYVHGGRVDEIVASATGGTSWLYHQYDARGHCIMLTNTSGGIQEQYEYDAFGQPYIYGADGALVARDLGSPVGNRFLFTGREWLKELRVYDYRNRLYQPELGRFLQPDPMQFSAGDYNRYRYCHNDPVNNSDPTGLREQIAGDIIWDMARYADAANTSQGSFKDFTNGAYMGAIGGGGDAPAGGGSPASGGSSEKLRMVPVKLFKDKKTAKPSEGGDKSGDFYDYRPMDSSGTKNINGQGYTIQEKLELVPGVPNNHKVTKKDEIANRFGTRRYLPRLRWALEPTK